MSDLLPSQTTDDSPQQQPAALLAFLRAHIPEFDDNRTLTSWRLPQLLLPRQQVIVRALEVGAHGGVSSDQLLLAIKGLSEGLTGHALVPEKLLALADKADGDT